MDALPKLSDEQVQQLKLQFHRKVDHFVDELVPSVDTAAFGRLIADSEEPVRKAIHAFGKAAYEAALQQKIDALEASFPPSAGNGG